MTITAIIIAKNEEQLIAACLQSVEWCDEVLVIDNGSTDDTVAVAEKAGAKVVEYKHSSFAQLRNKGLKLATSDWILYIDADERISPQLATEIKVNIETGAGTVFAFRRKNIFYGQHLQHGGWDTDVVQRVFSRSALQKWTGDIHESPQYDGRAVELKIPLLHLSHRDTQSGLVKTTYWTAQEAELLYKAGVPAVTFWTIVRKGVMEFIRRGILKQGYKDGETGLIEALIQGINRALVYIQVWERQRQPSLAQRYSELDAELRSLWHKHNTQNQ